MSAHSTHVNGHEPAGIVRGQNVGSRNTKWTPGVVGAVSNRINSAKIIIVSMYK